MYYVPGTYNILYYRDESMEIMERNVVTIIFNIKRIVLSYSEGERVL